MKAKYLFLILIFFLNFSCKQGDNRQMVQKNNGVEKGNMKDALITQNRQLIFEEMELIDAFSERYHLNPDTTATGLRYKIIEPTSGKPVRLMSDVTISYTASLLNGDVCYSSDSTGMLTFTIGQSDQPSGLQEGILKMKEGEKAVLIVPSYLAYGITGDGICIPGSNSIYYELKLEKVKN